MSRTHVPGGAAETISFKIVVFRVLERAESGIQRSIRQNVLCLVNLVLYI